MRERIYTSIFVLVFVVLGAFLLFKFLHVSHIKIVFLDVGQGNSSYIKTTNGFEIIIDTGESRKTLRNLAQHRFVWDRTVNLLLATHPDRDHIGVMPDLLRRYTFDNFGSTNKETDLGVFRALQDQLKKQGTEKYIFTAGDILVLDEDTQIEFFWPTESVDDLSDNNSSLVFKFSYQDFDVLFTGDIESEIEKTLVSVYGDQLASEVLVVAHHGSKSSSDESFIGTVSPHYAVVSAGADNRYGHPHASVLERFENFDIPVLRTDQLGNIEFKVYEDGVFDIITR